MLQIYHIIHVIHTHLYNVIRTYVCNENLTEQQVTQLGANLNCSNQRSFLKTAKNLIIVTTYNNTGNVSFVMLQ